MASPARKAFVQRLAAFRDASQHEVTLAQSLHNVSHNARARLFRNGLAVVGFAILEDFIRSRVAEVLSVIDGNAVRFDDLPEKLQSAATHGAVEALSLRARTMRRSAVDALPLIQDVGAALASTSQASFRISPLSLTWGGSNLTGKDISQTLGSLHVEGGWSAINDFAARAGLGIPALESVFSSLAQGRHNAAHNADADIAPPDLQDLPLEATAVAIAFDALASRACRILATSKTTSLGTKKVAGADISIRFLKHSSGRWREVREDHSKAIRRHKDLHVGIAKAHASAVKHHEFIVVQDARGIPVDWISTDVP